MIKDIILNILRISAWFAFGWGISDLIFQEVTIYTYILLLCSIPISIWDIVDKVKKYKEFKKRKTERQQLND